MVILDRKNFKTQFSYIYDKEPAEEQLDVFIAFMLGDETDVEKLSVFVMLIFLKIN